MINEDKNPTCAITTQEGLNQNINNIVLKSQWHEASLHVQEYEFKIVTSPEMLWLGWG